MSKRLADMTPEERAASQKWFAEYREKNKARNAARRAAYYEKNKARIAAQQAAFREKNKEQLAARRAAWRALGQCPHCKEHRPLATSSKCRECAAKHVAGVHGVTLEQYDEALARQNGRCAICDTTEPGGSTKRKQFASDHCHDTCVFRGLLCIQCNAGIGCLGDNPMTVARALLHLLPAFCAPLLAASEASNDNARSNENDSALAALTLSDQTAEKVLAPLARRARAV